MTKKRRHGSKKGGVKRPLPKWIWVMPFLLGAGIVPTIVRGKAVSLYEKALDLWPSVQGIAIDFFSYQKAVFLIFASIAALMLLITKKYKEGFSDYKYNLYVIPILAYSFLIILSTILSKYPKTSLNGFPDRYEGLIVLLGYVLLFLAATFSLDKEERIRTVLWCIFIPSFIVTGIGILQFFHLDPYRTDFVKRLILNATMYAEKESLSFNFSPGAVYTTLFNPNYVGSYCALLIPALIGFLIYEKEIRNKIILAVGVVFGLINIYGSRSTAGLMGLLVCAAFTALILIASCLKNRPKAIIAVLTAAVIFAGAFLYVNFTDYKGLGVIPDLKVTDIKDMPWYINDLTISGNKIVIKMNSSTLEVQNNMGKLEFFDGEGRQLKSEFNDSIYKIDDPRYSDMSFEIADTNLMLTVYPKKSSFFIVIMDTNGFYDVLGSLGKPAPVDRPDVWFFKGYERLGSGRGYIWGRSIPVLFKERPLFGSGPDTFAYVFPQNDVIGKMNASFQNNTVLVDKPHNMYMQAGINTGLLSMIALLSLFIAYIVQSLRLYWRISFNDRLTILGLALTGGSIGYMITGLFNDSDISVAPMFWVLFGCSVALNFMIQKRLYALKQNAVE